MRREPALPASPLVNRSDIASRFLHSAGAATFSQLWRVGVTLVIHLVLRRLVPREDWGLYDWAEVVFLVLGAVRDLGMPAHAVRSPSKPFGNLLAHQAGWGAGFAILVFFAAPVVALAFRGSHPLVVPVLRLMILFMFFEGLALVPLFWFERQLEVGRAVVPELVRNLCYAVVAVSLALDGRGVWSMVIAQVSASAVFAAMLWWRARGRMPLTWLKGQTLALIRKSAPLALIWLIILLVRYVDRLIIGYRFSAEALATYSFAYWAAFIVPTIFLQPVGRAAYPAFVAYSGEPARQLGTYRLSTLVLLGLEVPAAYFLFVNAELVLGLIGGGQWVGAPDYLRILCFAPLCDPLSRFGGELLATRGGDRLWVIASATTLVAFFTLGVVLTGLLGPRGMAWANYAPLGALVMAWAVRGLSPGDFSGLLRDLAWLYVVPAPFFAAAWLLGGQSEPGRLALSAVALAVTAALYWRRFGGQALEFFRSSREPAES